MTDVALLRFLRARVGPPVVLNDGACPSDEPARRPSALSGELLRQARGLRSDPAGAAGCVRALSAGLLDVSPTALGGRADREAFWINVYNALVLDAVAALGVRESVRELPGFYRRAAYRIGGETFTPEEIEHGILRGNHPPLPRLSAPFASDDPRVALVLAPPDPRVHFALNCGARSCPPIAAYDPAHLDEQLDLATRAFINSDGARVENGAVLLSPLFDWYSDDFGSDAGVRALLDRYLDDPELRARVASGEGEPGEYDWRLGG